MQNNSEELLDYGGKEWGPEKKIFTRLGAEQLKK